MSAIGTMNSSAGDTLVSLLRSSSAEGADLPAMPSAKTDTPARSGDGPAVVVDLSDRAKALLERNKVDRLVADRLAQQVSDANNPVGAKPASKSTSEDTSDLFDGLSGRTASPADSDKKWTADARAGDASISDAEFTAKYKRDLLSTFEGYYTPEKRAALEAAINNGTLKFQKGAEVLGYNARTTVTYTPDGQGMSTSGYRPATGAVKEALDAGNAIAMWTEDRGDVYVTW